MGEYVSKCLQTCHVVFLGRYVKNGVLFDKETTAQTYYKYQSFYVPFFVCCCVFHNCFLCPSLFCAIPG